MSAMCDFIEFALKDAGPLEQATGSRTLFYGQVGSNQVWGFAPPHGRLGVAITSDAGGQVVVNIDNLRTLLRLLEAGQKGMCAN